MTANDPFSQLLAMAREQTEPQRLLFVFAGAELPADATPQQRERFGRGEGGAPVPLMTVDKAPESLSDFAALAAEASAMHADWRLVFIAALGGRDGRPPDDATVDRALSTMEDAIKQGRVQGFLVLGRDGSPIRLS